MGVRPELVLFGLKVRIEARIWISVIIVCDGHRAAVGRSFPRTPRDVEDLRGVGMSVCVCVCVRARCVCVLYVCV